MGDVNTDGVCGLCFQKRVVGTEGPPWVLVCGWTVAAVVAFPATGFDESVSGVVFSQ